jgi:hypothetical protein
LKIKRGFKTELDPTPEQYVLFCQCAGAARFAYNYGLARKREAYKVGQKTPTAIDLQKEGKHKGKCGYPKFKSKKKGRGSFRLDCPIHVYEDAIGLPKIGLVKLKESAICPLGESPCYLPPSASKPVIGLSVFSVSVTSLSQNQPQGQPSG